MKNLDVRNQGFGIPLVVSAPSGGGKTTLCHKLRERLGSVVFSISHTTRPPRGNERDGIDYHFVDDETFDTMIANNDFLEWANVHGNRYGSSVQEASVQLESGVDVLFDIDIQGGYQIAQRVAETQLVFIVPPSLVALEQRLRGRSTDSDEVIARRLDAARQEIRGAGGYNYWIINDEIDQALQELEAVLLAARLRRLNKQAIQDHVLG